MLGYSSFMYTLYNKIGPVRTVAIHYMLQFPFKKIRTHKFGGALYVVQE